MSTHSPATTHPDRKPAAPMKKNLFRLFLAFALAGSLVRAWAAV